MRELLGRAQFSARSEFAECASDRGTFVLALVLYYPSVRVSKALAKEGVMDPALASWAGQGFLLLAAAGITWRLVRR